MKQDNFSEIDGSYFNPKKAYCCKETKKKEENGRKRS